MSRVLIVEDNANLAYGLRNNLEIAGYEVGLAEDGESALEGVSETPPDLIVLDLMLPGDLDGYRVLRRLREGGNDVPILILSARSEEADKVFGFRLGADDYVTKPFSVLEVVERVAALLRRAGRTGGAQETAGFGDVRIDHATRTVRRDGDLVLLTPLEFDLLVALLRRDGAVASRLDLLREVWGHQAAVVTRTVDTHVAELRRKLEDDPSSPRHILTVRKVGYRLER